MRGISLRRILRIKLKQSEETSSQSLHSESFFFEEEIASLRFEKLGYCSPHLRLPLLLLSLISRTLQGNRVQGLFSLPFFHIFLQLSSSRGRSLFHSSLQSQRKFQRKNLLEINGVSFIVSHISLEIMTALSFSSSLLTTFLCLLAWTTKLQRKSKCRVPKT